MTSGENSSRRVAVFDLDGTITDCDTYLKFLRLCLTRQPGRVMRSLHLPLAVLLCKAGVYDNAWLKSTFLKALAGGCDAVTLAGLVSTHIADIMAHHVRPAELEQIEHLRR